MAYVNTTGSVQSSIVARVLAGAASITSVLRKRQVYLTTMRELNDLSDRELSDLGIHRAMLSEIAREAAYGK
jgi:uncharacterized protein YjiS (DUF1127 family)